MIAILGATGYIGRSYARALAAEASPALALFARDPRKLENEAWPARVELRDLRDFRADRFSLVVNAIGAGDPARVAAMGQDVFQVTSTWDERVLATMAPETRYVFLSSGAVYGSASPGGITADSAVCLPVNGLEQVAPYTMAKLHAEARHRHLPQRSILDLRVFGYAELGLDLGSTFFLADLARAVIARTTFVTSPNDMIRDYAGARELGALVAAWESAGAPNRALDLYTRAPVAKFDLLDAARERYGFDVDASGCVADSPTGTKPFYASTYRAAADLGYRPERDALQVVLAMLDAIMARS